MVHALGPVASLLCLFRVWGHGPRSHGVFHTDLRQQLPGQPEMAGEALNAALLTSSQGRKQIDLGTVRGPKNSPEARRK